MSDQKEPAAPLTPTDLARLEALWCGDREWATDLREVFRLAGVGLEIHAEANKDLTIVHQPGRCSGHPTVGHTRICVHNIVQYLEDNGWDIEGYLNDFQHQTRAQVDAAIAYYRENEPEIRAIWEDQKRLYDEGLKAQEERERRKAAGLCMMCGAAPVPAWTREAPTEPGTYWWSPWAGATPALVEIRFSLADGLYAWDGTERKKASAFIGWWLRVEVPGAPQQGSEAEGE